MLRQAKTTFNCHPYPKNNYGEEGKDARVASTADLDNLVK
jgi:hypothetical protein